MLLDLRTPCAAQRLTEIRREKCLDQWKIPRSLEVHRPFIRTVNKYPPSRNAVTGHRRLTTTRQLSAIFCIAILALAGCSDAVQESDEGAGGVSVQVGAITKKDLRARVEAYGAVEPEPAKAGHPGGGAKLAAPIAGIVVGIHAKEGQSVKAGDVVVELDNRIAQAAIDKARHALVFAQQAAERQEKLINIGGTTMQAKQDAAQRLATARADLASAQAAIAQVQLASPLDGLVARVNALPGQTVDLNTVVAEIVDLKRLVATVAVPSDEAAQIKKGQTAEIYTDSSSKPITTGHVSFVSPSVDQRTGAAPVRILLPEDSGLRPGEFVRARIITEERIGCLAVPRESVVKVAGQPAIYLVKDHRAIQTPVDTGLRDGGFIEVKAKGLKVGDSIVAIGAYGLPDGTKIKTTKQ
ncbi:efflux RND transporter periplasmic adaptor subunit [Methylocystis rosea]|uniref:efflux RND transporter periplasmic adaptor subunit n=1 Tax=Methylocystis rosea TaxID=173366 RepID=UPI0013DD87D6|nr:efflux RND transporter periplasmic adaptor subunit [Methylocystis rosea]